MKRYLFLLLLFIANFKVYGSINESHSTTGGWVSVKRLSSSKLLITCNLLYEINGNTLDHVSGGSTHQLRMKSDTSVKLKVFDSLRNSIEIKAPWITGYLFTQKDTSKTYTDPNGAGYNKYYNIIFRCTLDLTSSIVTQNLKFSKSSFLDFTCDFTGEIYTTPGLYWNVNKAVNPTATTRVYLNELAIDENTLDYSHVAFTKLLDYNSSTYYASNSMNHGIYGNYGDSIYIELIKPENPLAINDTIVYIKGYDAKTPFYSYCIDSSNSCTPSPNSSPPRGFYFNNVSGDMVFTSAKSFQGSMYAMRCYQFRKNSAGKWVNKGFVTLTHSMLTISVNIPYDRISMGTVFPTFTLPTRVDLCEGDSVTNTVKTQIAYKSYKYIGWLDGNFPNKSLQVDYSTGNSTPTFKFKVVAKKGDYSSVPGIVTLRVNADSNWTYGEAAKSTLVYVHRPLIPEMKITTNGCNNIKAVISTVNSDVSVKKQWQVFKGSLTSKEIYNSTSDTLVFSGMQPDKYYIKCFVLPTQSNCKCSGKWAIDSIDMKALWPNLGFELNRNTVCLNDSTKVYFAKNIKGFKGKIKFFWDADSMIVLKDTLIRNFTGPVTFTLQIKDDSGCDFSQVFNLQQDPVYSLNIPKQILNCTADTLTLAASLSSIPGYWWGRYSVHNQFDSSIFTQEDSIFKFYYSKPNYKVHSEFVSEQGCNKNYLTDILIDTTTIRMDFSDVILCKQMKQFDFKSIAVSPKGGIWSNNVSGTNNLLRLDTFGYYPRSVEFQYEFKNVNTQCNHFFIDTLSVVDTVFKTLKPVNPICFELKKWDAAGYYGLPYSNKSKWLSNMSGLRIDSFGWIYPRESQSKKYDIGYASIDNNGCISLYSGKVQIKGQVLNLQASSDVTTGYSPFKVSFTGGNLLPNPTSYYWDFGNKQTLADTASGKSPIYTYFDSGSYFVTFVGRSNGCSDTLHLPKIRVGYLGLSGLKIPQSYLMLFPNPSTCEGYSLLDFNENPPTINSTIRIYNSLGSLVSELPVLANQQQLALKMSHTGNYFIKAEWLQSTVIWVVQ